MKTSLDDIRKLAFFRDLDAEGVERLLGASRVRSLPHRTVIFRQGEESHSAYVVVQGRVGISVLLPDGTEMTIDVLGPGDAFGLAGLASNMPRVSNAQAMRSSKVLQIPTNALQALVDRNPRFLMTVTAHLMRRLTRAIHEQVATSTQRVYARVAIKLLSLAETNEEGECRLPERLSHQALADMVGSTRATVTRVLQDLRRRGLLEIDAETGQFIICEAENLSGLADAGIVLPSLEGTILP